MKAKRIISVWLIYSRNSASSYYWGIFSDSTDSGAAVVLRTAPISNGIVLQQKSYVNNTNYIDE